MNTNQEVVSDWDGWWKARGAKPPRLSKKWKEKTPKKKIPKTIKNKKYLSSTRIELTKKKSSSRLISLRLGHFHFIL